MRVVAAYSLAVSISIAALGAVQAQIVVPSPAKSSAPAPTAAATPTATPTTATTGVQTSATPTPAPAQTCSNPNAIGIGRVVEIDTTGGPGFGFEHFKAYDFLRNNEVVLTFDDGPWPVNTPLVLAALAKHCTKALFLPIGKHAIWHPEILKQVEAGGHTIGSHTWSHVDLTPSAKRTLEDSKAEIEKGFSAVALALGHPAAPFFRFPQLKHPKELVEYLGQRNVGIWSTDMDSFDFKMRKPEQVVQSVLAKLKKFGKGIVLMHDFQQATAHALPDLLDQLKANGYKIVQVKAREQVKTIAEFDTQVTKEVGGGLENARPLSSVVRTIE